VDVGGLPLGTLPNPPPYRTAQVTLQDQDILVVCSDGIVEATNQSSELYGFDRLAACVASAPLGTARELQEWILADVRAFVGNAEPHDDITLIVMVMAGEIESGV
jgi:sigma-B regulation protein RsbU (phosphoserine phosphatase)